MTTECKFIVGKTYKDGHGADYRILATDAPGLYPVIALNANNGTVAQHRYDGRYMSCPIGSPLNLILPTEKRTMWVNAYPGSYLDMDRGYASKSLADGMASRDSRIACIEVTYEVPA